MTRQALFEHLVVGLRRCGHEAHAEALEGVPGLEQVIGQEGDVLDAFAVELHQELFDLPGALGRLFVQRNTDHAIRCGHGTRSQAGVLTLDVEVADFTEVEQLLVEAGPVRHAPAINVVGEVVDDLQAGTDRVAVHTFDELEVDVVDRAAFLETVDQVQRRTADALDRWQAQLHRAGFDFHRLGAQFQGAGIGLVGVTHAERHAAYRRAVFGGEVRGDALGFVVQDQVDVTLAIQVHILGPVGSHLGEAQHLEYRFEYARGRRSQFDEFEAHQAHWIVEDISHVRVLICSEKLLIA